MIESWRDAWLKDYFFEDMLLAEDSCGSARAIISQAEMLADATTDADLRVPPSNHFERLRGNLEGWHSIRVNDQWRLLFRWGDGQAQGVYLDKHSYR